MNFGSPDPPARLRAGRATCDRALATCKHGENCGAKRATAPPAPLDFARCQQTAIPVRALCSIVRETYCSCCGNDSCLGRRLHAISAQCLMGRRHPSLPPCRLRPSGGIPLARDARQRGADGAATAGARLRRDRSARCRSIRRARRPSIRGTSLRAVGRLVEPFLYTRRARSYSPVRLAIAFRCSQHHVSRRTTPHVDCSCARRVCLPVGGSSSEHRSARDRDRERGAAPTRARSGGARTRTAGAAQRLRSSGPDPRTVSSALRLRPSRALRPTPLVRGSGAFGKAYLGEVGVDVDGVPALYVERDGERRRYGRAVDADEP